MNELFAVLTRISQCPACSTDYSTSPADRLPKFIGCGHSLCSACSTARGWRRRRLRCPVCRRRSVVPIEGVSALPLNATMLDVVGLRDAVASRGLDLEMEDIVARHGMELFSTADRLSGILGRVRADMSALVQRRRDARRSARRSPTHQQPHQTVWRQGRRDSSSAGDADRLIKPTVTTAAAAAAAAAAAGDQDAPSSSSSSLLEPASHAKTKPSPSVVVSRPAPRKLELLPLASRTFPTVNWKSIIRLYFVVLTIGIVFALFIGV